MSVVMLLEELPREQTPAGREHRGFYYVLDYVGFLIV